MSGEADELMQERFWHPVSMNQLKRMILRHDNAAYEAWRRRYGHDYPVYAVINGEEIICEE